MHDISGVLKAVYTVFLGFLIALFVGLGIAAFYPGPKMPEYPTAAYKTSPENQETSVEQSKYDSDYKTYQEARKPYSRNVFIIAVIAAVLLLTISLLAVKALGFLADGFLLGGVLTLGYSIIQSIESGSDQFRFLAVTIGLVIVVILGYLKFVKQTLKVSK